MESTRFDSLARRLAAGGSRRTLLGALGTGIVGLLVGAGARTPEQADAVSATCKGAGRSCSANSTCCSGVCCQQVCCAPGYVCRNGRCRRPTTPTSTSTATPTGTATSTPSVPPTDTPSATPTDTPTATGPSPTPTNTPVISGGCQTINEFGGGGVIRVSFPGYQFLAGERIDYEVSKLGDENDTTAQLFINGAIVDEGPVPTSLTYTIPADGTYDVIMETAPPTVVQAQTTCIPVFA